jgi:endonuclease YncB( thermonuclease family)
MIKFLPILIAASLAVLSTAVARDEIEGPVAAEIIRVIDGDTLLVEATPWPQQRMEVYVRIRGIDAPELHSKCAEIRKAGLDARHALEELTAQSPAVRLTDIAGDKYFGRILANVTLADGSNPAQDLLADGVAREYDGGRKPTTVCGE